VALPLAGGASLALHLGMAALLAIAIAPKPFAPQLPPPAKLAVEAYQVDRSTAAETRPEAEAATEESAAGDAAQPGAVPQSRAKPVAAPPEKGTVGRAADSETPRATPLVGCADCGPGELAQEGRIADDEVEAVRCVRPQVWAPAEGVTDGEVHARTSSDGPLAPGPVIDVRREQTRLDRQGVGHHAEEATVACRGVAHRAWRLATVESCTYQMACEGYRSEDRADVAGAPHPTTVGTVGSRIRRRCMPGRT
jgi:hypothetical protein